MRFSPNTSKVAHTKRVSNTLILIDNFDSFTYNISHAFEEIGLSVRVFRNDVITCEELISLNPDYLVIGPGPGNPAKAGRSLEYIEKLKGELPILGICLGHQAIGEAFGAKVCRAKLPMHGKISPIFHQGKGLFQGIAQGISVNRYHSLVIEPSSLPVCLEMTAWTEEGEMMGICHKEYPLMGLQFHPESIATECGLDFLKNFLSSLN